MSFVGALSSEVGSSIRVHGSIAPPQFHSNTKMKMVPTSGSHPLIRDWDRARSFKNITSPSDDIWVTNQLPVNVTTHSVLSVSKWYSPLPDVQCIPTPLGSLLLLGQVSSKLRQAMHAASTRDSVKSRYLYIKEFEISDHLIGNFCHFTLVCFSHRASIFMQVLYGVTSYWPTEMSGLFLRGLWKPQFPLTTLTLLSCQNLLEGLWNFD